MQNVVISATDIFERLKADLNLRNDAELARKLEVQPKKLAVWKVRNTVPYEVLITFCRQAGLNLERVLTGEGEEREPAAPISSRAAALVDNFEAMSEEDKRAFERLVSTVAESGKRVKKKAG